MLKSLKKKMKDQAGLTLIELLVVIVILGIIAAVAIPMVMSQQDSAEGNTNEQNRQIIQDAINRYHTLNGSYPGSATDSNWKTDLTVGTTTNNGPFLDSVPTTVGCEDADFIYSSGKVTIPEGCPQDN